MSTLASGYRLSIPVLVIRGEKPGPRVGVSAMVHGDEIDGLLIIRELWRTIDPGEVSGSLWLMPVANPLAMEAITRNTPIDMLDMNRLFPGQPDGWLSEQQAHAITNGFINEVDCLIDIHAGGTFPWVDYCYALNDEAFARAFLSALLYKPTVMYPATTASVAIARNIPISVIEIGGGYHDQEEHVRNGVRRVTNMMRHVGALPGTVERRPHQLLLHEIKVMRPRNGGLCVPHRKVVPGTWLDGEHALADIVHPHSLEALETMVTPFEKNVMVLARNSAPPYEISAIYAMQSRRATQLAIGWSFLFQAFVGVGVLIFGLSMRVAMPHLPEPDLGTPVLGMSMLPFGIGILVLLATCVAWSLVAQPYFLGLDPAEAGVLVSAALFVGVSLGTEPVRAEKVNVFFPL